MAGRTRPLIYMRQDGEVHAAVTAVAASAGLPIGATVELICAEHLGMTLDQPARADVVRAAVRRYRREHRGARPAG